MAKGGAKKKKQDPRKGTWDEATDSDSEDECEKVAPKKTPRRRRRSQGKKLPTLTPKVRVRR